MTSPDHYEVELRELTCVSGGPGGFQITGSSWIPIRVFPRDTIPTLLTFDALGAAQAYVGRHRPDAARIVRVTDEGRRLVVEAPGS